MTLDRAKVGSRFGVKRGGGSPVALDKCAMDTAWRVPVASRGSTDLMRIKGPKRLNFTSTWTQDGFKELQEG